jgi:hypothetical protein
LLEQIGNALIDRNPLVITHLYPTGNFIKCAQTAAAHIVA